MDIEDSSDDSEDSSATSSGEDSSEDSSKDSSENSSEDACGGSPDEDLSLSCQPRMVSPELPPYTQEDEAKLEGEGLTCYFPRCQFKFKSWLSIVAHLRRKHNVSQRQIADCYAVKRANAELQEHRRNSCLRKKQPAEGEPPLLPPWTEQDEARLGEGLPCHFPRCQCKCHSWYQVFKHLENVHHIKMSQLTEWQRRKYNAERRKKDAERRRRCPENV